MCACLALTAPAAAFAQGSLPDPNGEDKQAAASNGSLPRTGLPVAVIAASGFALIAMGRSIRPAARRRRAYDADQWRHELSSHPVSDGSSRDAERS